MVLFIILKGEGGVKTFSASLLIRPCGVGAAFLYTVGIFEGITFYRWYRLKSEKPRSLTALNDTSKLVIEESYPSPMNF